MKGFRGRSRWALCLLLAVAYFATASLGLRVATVGHSVTLIWPPTGLATASLLLFGTHLWPGVALGAFAVNASTTGVPILAALGMAAGNTAEALLGAILLRRAGFDAGLRRMSDVLRFVGAAAMGSTLVAASMGTISLWLGGVIDAAALPATWGIWWVGDMMGDLVIAPVLLCWWTPGTTAQSRRYAEGALLAALLVLVTIVVFRPPVAWRLPGYALTYVTFPLLIWASLRFGPRGAATANFLVALVAVLNTAAGHGPFAQPDLNESFLLLQGFLGVVTLTSLALGATAAERAHAVQVREDFISIASHELKTPLTPLRLQIQRLARTIKRKTLAALTAEDVQSVLTIAERQIDRLVALVEELLDVTRLRVAGLTLTPQDLDLESVVRETSDSLADEMAAAHCAIEFHLAGPIPGHWDRLRLQQVITNLLSNAMKFGKGKPISVAAHAAGNIATFSVSDRGPGIAKKDQLRIFGRFERSSTGHHYQGLGLGLYISRKIVEAHGGRIGIDSRPGAGATFIVELPARPHYPQAPEEGSQSQPWPDG